LTHIYVTINILISLFKKSQEIVQNYKEKVDLLEEESSKLKQSLEQKTERISTMEEQVWEEFEIFA
jgi:prefoldin subunit 5